MESLESLLVIYEDALLKECWKYCKQQADVWNLYQEAALKMVDGYAGFDETRPFLPWARRIIQRTFLNMKRAEEAEKQYFDVAFRGNLDYFAFEKPHMQDSILELLPLMEPMDAKLLTAVYINGVSQAVIADFFNISQQAVSKRIQKASDRLKELYYEHFGDYNKPDNKRSA
jgi:RNA polymerase sigma factor (sigma-70 family)